MPFWDSGTPARGKDGAPPLWSDLAPSIQNPRSQNLFVRASRTAPRVRHGPCCLFSRSPPPPAGAPFKARCGPKNNAFGPSWPPLSGVGSGSWGHNMTTGNVFFNFSFSFQNGKIIQSGADLAASGPCSLHTCPLGPTWPPGTWAVSGYWDQDRTRIGHRG